MRKKEFTSFDVAAVVRELKEGIPNSRVSNVYQVDSKIFLLKLHKSDKPSFGLLLEAGKRLHSTAYDLEKPTVPPAFCMALRKYLRNNWLIGVEQYEFERIVVFSFKTKLGSLRLVLELFGDGNIILIDEKGEILHALIYKRMRDRNVLRGEKFVYPPSSGMNPFKVVREEFHERLKSFGDVEVVRTIVRFLSIGGLYAEETLLVASIDKSKPCNMLTDADFNAIFDNLQTLLSLVASGKFEPCIILDEKGDFVDAVPFRLKRYEGFATKSFNSFNEALDQFFAVITTVEKSKAVTSVEAEKLKQEANRLKRIIESQKKVLAEASTEAERYRRIGDVIYAHINEIQFLIDRFLTAKESGKDWKDIASEGLAQKIAGVKPWVFFDSLDAKGLIVHICIDDLLFSLDIHAKLFDNAGRYYEKSKKAKQKLEGAQTALNDTRRKLAEVEDEIRKTEALERVDPLDVIEKIATHKAKRKEWFEKFRWFVSSDDFLIVAGKDAVSNEVLVKKHAEPNDVVFHADIVGAPFVLIKSSGKTLNGPCLREAGEFAAAYSRAWREGFGSIDVYWVKPDQLSKGGPSGESVPHGGFVVSGKRNWIRGVLLRIAIGVIVDKDGEIRFVGGPVDAIIAKTKIHVTISPGNESAKELFKRVLKTLSEKVPKEQREKILKASIEELREFIPYNKGRITDNIAPDAL